MKNVILIINPDEVSISSIHFGCYVAQLTESRLTGLFLEKNIGNQTPTLKSLFGQTYVETIVASDLPGYQEHSAARMNSLEIFKKICLENGVRFSIVSQVSFSVKEIVAETRFADLLIISREITLEQDSEKAPSDFLKEILSQNECPVMVAPLTFDGIDEILLAYDESRSSAFAIKQFTYLFPELEALKLTMLHVQKHFDHSDVHWEKLTRWISAHYSYPIIKVVEGNPGPELLNFLSLKRRTLVIMGSYGRNALSSMVFPSTADTLLESLDLPFFFTHH